MIFFIMQASASPLLNEVLYDAPSGVDESDNEWVELCNPTEEDIDVSGWSLQRAGNSFEEIDVFPAGTTVPALGYLVVYGAFSLDLQNGGSATDGVRLISASGAIADTLLYDQPNTNNLTDDWGSVNGPFAPDVSAGHSLARFPDCSELNNDASDWIDASSPTPGAENTSNSSGGGSNGSATCVETVQPSAVVINEIVSDPAGSDSGYEWVELRNNTSNSIDMSGWILSGGSSSFSTQAEFPQGTVILPGAYLLVGGENVFFEASGRLPDVVDSLSLGNAGSNADAIRLEDCGGGIVDTVIYGEVLNDSDGWVDDLGQTPNGLAPKPRSGQSIGRVPDGVDTDYSDVDFQLLDFVSPWDPNDLAPVCDGASDIKINEFIPNPDSDETSADETFEWIELFNNADSVVDLSGWSVQWGTSSYSNSYTIPEGNAIAPRSFFLIGGEGVSNPFPDAVVSDDGFSFGSGGSNADSVRLLHCGPGVSDTVIYGPTLEDGLADNEDLWEDDLGQVATSIAPKPSAGASLSRRTDGVDSDDNGIDFYLSQFISPGSSNPIVRCTEGNQNIKINEFLPNPDGSDGGKEWIEFFNAGDVAVELDGWRVEVFGSSWSEKYTFSTGVVLNPSEYFLLAEEDVPEEFASDYTSLSLGNASTGFDGIRLLDCPGEIQDIVLYGKSGATPSEDEDSVSDQLGGSTFVSFPDSGKSVGRHPDGEDSDDISIDFKTNMEPSPGRSNSYGSQGVEDTGTVDPIVGKGCGKSPDPNPSEPTAKCNTVPIKQSTILFCSILLIAFRRRT